MGVRKVKYVATFSLATLIFISGLIVGQIIAEVKFKEFTAVATELKTSLLAMDTQEKIAEKYLCDVDIFKLTEEKSKLGRRLAFLEEKYGKNDEKVIALKKEYSLLSIRQWLLVEEFKDNCYGNLTIILFFYSNRRNVSDSEIQGSILDYIYYHYPKKVVIYAFDYDLDLEVINILKEVFGIKQVPSLIINQKVYTGLVSREMIEELL
jgi:hypothetical protein